MTETPVVIVTGGATELGGALTRRLVADGHRVAVSDPDLVGGRALVDSLHASPGQAAFIGVDLEDEHGAADLVQRTLRRFGRIDAAVNNVWACQGGGMLHECDADFLDRTVGVALREVFLAMRSQVRHFRDHGGGVIINTVSSDLGALPDLSESDGQDDFVDLTAIDVEILSRRAALDYARDNVRVHSYAAGVVVDLDSPRLRPPRRQHTSRSAAADQVAARLTAELGIVSAAAREVGLVAG